MALPAAGDHGAGDRGNHSSSRGRLGMTNVITFAEAAERRRPIVRASRMSSVEQEPELSARDKRRAKREERLAEVATNPNLTTTCRNQRLRLSRRDTGSIGVDRLLVCPLEV